MITLLLSLALASAPAPSNDVGDSLAASCREVLGGKPLSPALTQVLVELPAALATPRFRAEAPALLEAAIRDFPATPRGRCLRDILEIRAGFAWRSPLLYRRSYDDAHALCEQLPALPAAERLLLLDFHRKQCGIQCNAFSQSRTLYHQAGWDRCLSLALPAAVDYLRDCPASSTPAQLAARARLLEEWWLSFNHAYPDENFFDAAAWEKLNAAPCAAPWLQAYFRALILIPTCACAPLRPGQDRPAALRRARAELAAAAAPEAWLHDFLLFRLDAELAAGPEQLQTSFDALRRLNPGSRELHERWAVCLSPKARGNIRLLQAQINAVCRDPDAFSPDGYPLGLAYLNRLLIDEGAAVDQESWVQEARSACRAQLEKRAAAGLPCDLLPRRRSQLLRGLLVHPDYYRRECAGADLLRDFDFSVLRPAISGPLDLARPFAAKLQPALVKEIDSRLDWQRGNPADQAPDAAALLALEQRLQAAAVDPEPQARNWFLAWSRICKLNRDFLAGDWVELRHDDPWLWCCSGGDIQADAPQAHNWFLAWSRIGKLNRGFLAGDWVELRHADPWLWCCRGGDSQVDAPDALLASTMHGERFLSSHAGVFLPPLQAQLTVTPHHLHDEVHGAGNCLFGISSGDLVSIPIAGRLFAGDRVSKALVYASRQAVGTIVNRNFDLKARSELPTSTDLLLYPDSADFAYWGQSRIGKDIAVERFYPGLTMLGDEVTEKAEAPFVPGQLGLAAPSTQNGVVHLSTLKIRRLAMPEAPQTAYWKKRYELCFTRYNFIQYAASLVQARHPRELTPLLKDLELMAGLTLPSQQEQEFDSLSFVPESRRVLAASYALLGRPHDAARIAALLVERTPLDDSGELSRNRMDWVRLIALDPQASPEELGRAAEAVRHALRKSVPAQRCLARRAQAALLARQGDLDAARRSLAIARALGKDLADYRELLQEKEPWE